MMNLSSFNTVSNYISLLRILLAIPLWISLSTHTSSDPDYTSAALALFAAFTDVLDGYLARKLNQVSEWGKIIDPIADKVCVGIIGLQMYLSGRIDGVIISVILGRDLLIVLAGMLLSKRLKNVLPSNYLGKITVIIISFYTLFLMFRLDLTYKTAHQLFYVSVIVMSVVSLIGYGIRALEFLKKNTNETV